MAAGRPGVNNNAGPNGAEMFRPGSVPSQYMYDGYGNVNNSGQMMISGGGTNFDSSFDAYGGQADAADGSEAGRGRKWQVRCRCRCEATKMAEVLVGTALNKLG